MKRNYGILFGLALGLVAIFGSPNSAQAGGTGGGGGSTETGTPFTFAHIASISGSTPSFSGTYTLTQIVPSYYPYATLSFSLKGKPINLPDGTALQVTVYTSDPITGEAKPPVTTPVPMTVLSKLGAEKASLNLYNMPGDLDPIRLDFIEVTSSNGTVIVDAHA